MEKKLSKREQAKKRYVDNILAGNNACPMCGNEMGVYSVVCDKCAEKVQ